MDMPTVEQVFQWGTGIVTGASVVRASLVKVEGLFEVWVAKSSESRFWRLYEKVIASLAYASISPNRADDKILSSAPKK